MSIVLFCKSCLNLVFHSVCELFGPAFLVILFQTKLWSWRGWVNQWHDIDTQPQFAKIVRNVTEAIARLFIQTNSFQCWMTDPQERDSNTRLFQYCSAGSTRLTEHCSSHFSDKCLSETTNVFGQRQTLVGNDKCLSVELNLNWENPWLTHRTALYDLSDEKRQTHACRHLSFFSGILVHKKVYVGHY